MTLKTVPTVTLAQKTVLTDMPAEMTLRTVPADTSDSP